MDHVLTLGEACLLLALLLGVLHGGEYLITRDMTSEEIEAMQNDDPWDV